MTIGLRLEASDLTKEMTTHLPVSQSLENSIKMKNNATRNAENLTKIYFRLQMLKMVRQVGSLGGRTRVIRSVI